MTFLDQVKKYAAFILMALLLGGVVYGYVQYQSLQSDIAKWKNAAAEKDKTIEEMKGTYTKLATERDDLKSSNADLAKLLKKSGQDLIAEQQVTAYWKGKYTYEVNHKPVPPVTDPTTPPVVAKPGTCTETYQTYRGEQDIGLLKLTIDTTTIDPTYKTSLTVEPGSKPLKLTLDLTRDKDKAWHTHVVSSDERIGVDIGVNSVNIEPLEPHWYEKLKVHADIGASLTGGGVLGGVGLGYQFGQFDLGPSIWGTTNGNAYGGLNFSWAPFKSK